MTARASSPFSGCQAPAPFNDRHILQLQARQPVASLSRLAAARSGNSGRRIGIRWPRARMIALRTALDDQHRYKRPDPYAQDHAAAPTLARCSAATFSSRRGAARHKPCFHSHCHSSRVQICASTLISKRGRHDKRWMPGRTAEIDQASLGQKDHPFTIGKLNLVNLWLDLDPSVII